MYQNVVTFCHRLADMLSLVFQKCFFILENVFFMLLVEILRAVLSSFRCYFYRKLKIPWCCVGGWRILVMSLRAGNWQYSSSEHYCNCQKPCSECYYCIQEFRINPAVILSKHPLECPSSFLKLTFSAWAWVEEISEMFYFELRTGCPSLVFVV